MNHAIRLLTVLALIVPASALAAPKCKVVITPAQGTTVPEGSFEFKATVQPATCSQSLTWSASEGVIQDGHFQAPVFAPSDKEPVKNITIVAKQTDDPHAEAYAFVKVSDGKAAVPPSNKNSDKSNQK